MIKGNSNSTSFIPVFDPRLPVGVISKQDRLAGYQKLVRMQHVVAHHRKVVVGIYDTSASPKPNCLSKSTARRMALFFDSPFNNAGSCNHSLRHLTLELA